MAPKIIFIVPYRDRKEHKQFFMKYMEFIMEDYKKEDYEIFFIHQCDSKPFNRGAMKNIGFLAIKEKYPEDYQNITFVFNDIDCMPFKKDQINYKTTHGNVKHFYGYEFALGGVVSITGKDFETINGYPNFWAWGWEDNELNRRVRINKLHVDHSQFYEMLSKEFIHLHHGLFREINHLEKKRYNHLTTEGIKQIKLGKYTVDGNMIQVDEFSTGSEPQSSENTIKLLGHPTLQKPKMRMAIT